MTSMQDAYARRVKIAEVDLCHGCDEKPITDIWHSLCTECAINAEAAAYDAQFEEPMNSLKVGSKEVQAQ